LSITQPLFTISADYENTDKFIEDENTINTDQVMYFAGNVIINGTYIVLGDMVII